MIPDLPGLPAANFTAWATTELPEWGPVEDAELIAGGLSNLTYRVRFGRGTLILRRPPRGPVLPSAHDMAREFRVLSGLQNTAVPVARTVTFHPGKDLLGAAFYLVEEVPGEVYRSPEQTAALGEQNRAKISAAVVETLALVHEVDLEASGLQDFGRPNGYLRRQIRRWGQQWAASKTRDLPAMDTLLAELGARSPDDSASTLVHGDYRLDNMIVRGQSVVAVVDWELSTLGDPLADLALTLTYWGDGGTDSGGVISIAAGVTSGTGFLTADEFALAYAARTGRSLERLPFYRAFAEFKLAVILEGVHARYLSGGTVGEGYAHAGQSVPLLVERALQSLNT